MACFPIDAAAAEMLRSLTRNKVYEAKSKSLFEALKKDLRNARNLEKALVKYRRFDAGNKIQMGKLGAISGPQ